MSLKKYYWAYFGLYILFNVILFAVSFFIDFGSSLSFLTAFVAAISTGQIFVKDQRRAPNPAEKKRLVWGSLAISWGSSLLLTLVALALMTWAGDNMAFIQTLRSGVFLLTMLVILMVLLLISYAMTSWAYGGMANRFALKANKI
ncbi:MAG: hypothetical protein EOO69_11930 [Moraxellaceae bacterium]|nr:MAG: hypothetical protein EOO69_11930 [Moraxellaceae bacterium]